VLKYILKRLFYGFLVIFGVITLVFFLFNILPGDPANMLLGQRSDKSSVEIIKKDLGLDKPLYIQYLSYLNDLSPVSFHSTDKESTFFYDLKKYTKSKVIIQTSTKTIALKLPYLRRSYQNKKLVTEIIAEAFPQTAILALVSIFISIIIGIALGIFCGYYKDTFLDKIFLIISVIGMSVPSFFAAILIAWFFAYELHEFTNLNMIGNLYTIDDFGNKEHIDLKNLILPAITLGIRPLAVVTELMRSSVIDTLSKDYVRTAYAKGLKPFKVIWKHVIKNSLNPVVTAISGWLAAMIAGTIFIEYIFDWKGLGIVIINALEKYDFPVLMGTLLFISIILIIINIFVDIIYGYLDPKVKLKN